MCKCKRNDCCKQPSNEGLNARLIEGIRQAEAGETVDRGDFSQYLEDDDENDEGVRGGDH